MRLPRWPWLPGRSPQAQLAQARQLAEQGRVPEALAIWTRLAEKGVPRAQTNLGASLATGTGIAQDRDAARTWLERGATAGDPLGQRNLALLIFEADEPAALDWFRRAADQGDPVSQDQLGHLLAATDPAEARRRSEQAAQQGVRAACTRLATMCHDAQGGPRDPEAAVRWWRQAAQEGDGEAAAMLGAALHMGQGTPKDDVTAMAWLIVAARRHTPRVRPFFTTVEASLTPGELARARAMAGEWPDP